ncbi:MAG: hypothetical protein EBU70_09405, partial [Actinobacteria bacterium]|nr:hypothetical protein [Actinomycetota bacterium]
MADVGDELRAERLESPQLGAVLEHQQHLGRSGRTRERHDRAARDVLARCGREAKFRVGASTGLSRTGDQRVELRAARELDDEAAFDGPVLGVEQALRRGIDGHDPVEPVQRDDPDGRGLDDRAQLRERAVEAHGLACRHAGAPHGVMVVSAKRAERRGDAPAVGGAPRPRREECGPERQRGHARGHEGHEPRGSCLGFLHRGHVTPPA